MDRSSQSLPTATFATRPTKVSSSTGLPSTLPDVRGRQNLSPVMKVMSRDTRSGRSPGLSTPPFRLIPPPGSSIMIARVWWSPNTARWAAPFASSHGMGHLPS